MGSIKSGARCVRNFDPVYVGLGSKTVVGRRMNHVCSATRNGHSCERPLSARSDRARLGPL